MISLSWGHAEMIRVSKWVRFAQPRRMTELPESKCGRNLDSTRARRLDKGANIRPRELISQDGDERIFLREPIWTCRMHETTGESSRNRANSRSLAAREECFVSEMMIWEKRVLLADVCHGRPSMVHEDRVNISPERYWIIMSVSSNGSILVVSKQWLVPFSLTWQRESESDDW